MNDTCRQFDSLIARAGQLSTAEAGTLEAHLAGCSSCRELARLLEPAPDRSAFAATNASEPAATTGSRDYSLPEITRDRYQISDEVGRGGIGRVLRALDQVLDRPVALKELFSVNDATRKRFVREVLITARLQHPSIVPVYDAGHRGDRAPFYAMKLVAGRPLDQAIADAATLAQRLALLPTVLAIADAMAYAHSERIIHRDLKPANVLVGKYGETVVIDWGLAKDLAVDDRDALDAGPYRAADAAHTVAGVLMGTPAYMAPEQAAGEPVDERADVYALGAILYHVVSGAIPHEGDSLEHMVYRVAHGEVRPLTERAPEVPRDLAAIVTKAMALAPAHRYATAQGLADDLRRYLTGQLVASHSYGTRELLRRWIKRHRAAVTVALAALVVLSVAGVVSVMRVVHARQQASDAAAVATHRLAEMLQEQGRQELLAGRPARAAVYLSEAQTQDHDADVALRALLAEAMRSLDAQRMSLEGHIRELSMAAISPDRTRIVTVSQDQSTRLWDAATGTVVATLFGGGLTGEGFTTASFSPDSARLLTAGGDDTVRIWDARTGELRAKFNDDNEILTAAFSPDGARVVSAGRGGMAALWDARAGRFLASLDGHRGDVDSAAFSADGTRVITADNDTVNIWDAATGARLRSLEGHRAAMSPDGSLIVTIGDTARMWTWTGQLVASLDGHTGPIVAVAYSPDGSRLVTSSVDRSAKLWDGRTGKLLGSLVGHTAAVKSAVFSPDGSRVVTAGYDHTAKLWDVETSRLLASFEGHRDAVESAVFNSDGTQVLTASADGTAKVWDASPSKRRVSLASGGNLTDGTLSPDGTHFVGFANHESEAKIWEVQTGRLVSSLAHRGEVVWADYDPTGSRIITASADHTVKLWDASTGKLVVSLDDDAHIASVSPDGARVVTAGTDRGARIWNATTGKLIATLDATELPHIMIDTDHVNWAAFSRDSTRVVTASSDGTGRVWRTDTGALVAQLDGHLDRVVWAAFSNDGARVVTASNDKTAMVWDARTGAQLASLEGHTAALIKATFSPDGTRVLTASDDHTAKLWDARTGALVTSFDGHSERVVHAAFSPDSDGARVLTLSVDRTVKLWDTRTGALLTSLDGHAGYLFEILFSPDGARITTGSNDGTLGIWDVHLETRTPQEVQRIISARDPWTFSNGRLVPIPAALAALVPPVPNSPALAATAAAGGVTSSDDYAAKIASLTRGRFDLFTEPDCDKLAANMRAYEAANQTTIAAIRAWKKTHTVDKPAVVKAMASTMRDLANNRPALAVMRKCKHHKAYAAAIEDM